MIEIDIQRLAQSVQYRFCVIEGATVLVKDRHHNSTTIPRDLVLV